MTIADGTQASPGDLIICTRNNHDVEAGEPGRTLANGDLLRIEAVTRGGLIVRRALDPNPATGQRRWTAQAFRYRRRPVRTTTASVPVRRCVSSSGRFGR